MGYPDEPKARLPRPLQPRCHKIEQDQLTIIT